MDRPAGWLVDTVVAVLPDWLSHGAAPGPFLANVDPVGDAFLMPGPLLPPSSDEAEWPRFLQFVVRLHGSIACVLVLPRLEPGDSHQGRLIVVGSDGTTNDPEIREIGFIHDGFERWKLLSPEAIVERPERPRWCDALLRMNFGPIPDAGSRFRAEFDRQGHRAVRFPAPLRAALRHAAAQVAEREMRGPLPAAASGLPAWTELVPREIGNCKLSRTVDRRSKSPGLGCSYVYRSEAHRCDITLSIYDRGQRDLKDGLDDERVFEELSRAYMEIGYNGTQTGARMGHVVDTAVAWYQSASGAPRAMLCSTFRTWMGTQGFTSTICLRCSRGRFLKLRLSVPVEIASTPEFAQENARISGSVADLLLLLG